MCALVPVPCLRRRPPRLFAITGKGALCLCQSVALHGMLSRAEPGTTVGRR